MLCDFVVPRIQNMVYNTNSNPGKKERINEGIKMIIIVLEWCESMRIDVIS